MHAGNQKNAAMPNRHPHTTKTDIAACPIQASPCMSAPTTTPFILPKPITTTTWKIRISRTMT